MRNRHSKEIKTTTKAVINILHISRIMPKAYELTKEEHDEMQQYIDLDYT